MLSVKKFTFNPFQENTYALYDETKECIIVDPGCSNATEEQQLISFISDQGLQVVKLINTHCHIDHVLGNRLVHEKYNVPLHAHKDEQPVLDACTMVSQMYGIDYSKVSPAISTYLVPGEQLTFGDTAMDIKYTPGHSPASVSLYDQESGIIIAGDVLFFGSIGRTDLPGGNYDTLIASIESELMILPDETVVYSGHGLETTIGRERVANPFLNQ